MKKFLVYVLVLLSLFSFAYANEETEESGLKFYVIADSLNARMAPRKKSVVQTVLENGTVVTATGRWSKDHKWVEIDHSEFGLLWCSYKYVTERTDSFLIETLWDSPIKIRKEPISGRVTGYLKKGKTMEIYQVVLGWGRCSAGWIDLDYCIEIEE